MKHRIFTVLSATIVCAIVFQTCSCSNSAAKHENIDGGDGTKHITPAQYAEADIEYTLNISDGKYSATLSVVRNGNISEADITAPDGLAGVHIVYDTEGMRITPPNGEIMALTDEAGAGLRIFFDVMAQIPSDGEKTAEGLYSFRRSGFDITLLLTDDGLPRLITVKKDGVTRHGEIAFNDAAS